MSRQNQNRRHNQPNHHINPSNTSPNHSENLPHGNDNETREANIGETKTINANVNIIGDKKWVRTEIISVISLFVGIVMALVTYRLFEISAKGTAAAIRADSIAKAALDESKINNAKAIDKQNIAERRTDSQAIIKSKRDDSIFDYQKQSFNTQITSLQVTQKEFEIENRSFLYIAHIGMDSVQSSYLKGFFYIINAGKQPGEMIEVKMETAISKDTNVYKTMNPIVIKKFGRFISNTIPERIDLMFENSTRSNIYDFINGVSFVFIKGSILYKSTVSNTIHKTIFCYKVAAKPRVNIVAIEEKYE